MHSRNSAFAQRRDLFFPSRMRRRSSYLNMNKTPEARPAKSPSQPVRPTPPYFKFSSTIWENLQTHNPYIKSWELGKVVAKMWRNLPEVERKPYVDAYDAEMVEYEKALKTYHNLPGCHAQPTGKSNTQKYVQPEGCFESNAYKNPTEILDVGDIDFHDYSYNIKYASYIRFMRNQQLISVIFSDEIVTVPSFNLKEYFNESQQRKEEIKHHINELNLEIEALERKHLCKKRNHAYLDNAFRQKLRKFKI